MISETGGPAAYDLAIEREYTFVIPPPVKRYRRGDPELLPDNPIRGEQVQGWVDAAIVNGRVGDDGDELQDFMETRLAAAVGVCAAKKDCTLAIECPGLGDDARVAGKKLFARCAIGGISDKDEIVRREAQCMEKHEQVPELVTARAHAVLSAYLGAKRTKAAADKQYREEVAKL